MPQSEVTVLDKGFVRLVDAMGSDLSVVNAARVSFGKRKDMFDEGDKKLIKYLAVHEHTSPFRHAYMQFHVKAPIFVFRQWMKHQVGCLAGDTEIHFEKVHGTKNGTEKVTIAKLYELWTEGNHSAWCKSGRQDYKARLMKRKVRCLDEGTGELATNRIREVLFQGRKEVFEVRTSSGYAIKCTADHRLWTEQGWQRLDACVNDLHHFKAAFHKLAVNGLAVAGDGRYRDASYLQTSYKGGKTIRDMAKECGCSPESIKKWCYRFKIPFNKIDTTFEEGLVPWNQGKRYRLPHTLGRKGPNGRKGEASNFWRGGVERSFRAEVGVWTASVAKSVHRQFGFQCRLCGGGGTLHAHHVIPVYQDASRAFDESNLVSLCGPCHRDVHRSVESESRLAARLLESPLIFKPRLNPNKGLHLHVKFDEIVSVTPMGVEDVFDLVMEDPSHPNFVANGMVVHNCSWNEISGRYVEFADDEFFVPASFRQQAKVNKQGSDGEIEESNRGPALDAYLEACQGSVAQYKKMLGLGVCREQARCVLPLGLYSEVYWTTSLQAVAHFIRLRTESHAQWEIQQYAHAVRTLIEDRFSASLEALLDSDKG